ncbi:MAG TPA: hypothetical protein VJ890_20520 [Vineibacter sp.]|nr:hypothetical protein [Vineibacter sp.]
MLLKAPIELPAAGAPGSRWTEVADECSPRGSRAASDIHPLDALCDQLSDAAASAAFATDETRDLAGLCRLALRQVAALRARGRDALPWRVGLFGSAHVTRRQLAYRHPGGPGSVKFLDLDSGRRCAPPRPEIRYGAAVDSDSHVTTEGCGALLLSEDGRLVYLPPFHTCAVRSLGLPWFRPQPLEAGV